MFAEKPANWKGILQNLHMDPNIDFYQKFYEPLLQDRIKNIITASWARSMTDTEKQISELFEGNLSGKFKIFYSNSILFFQSIYRRESILGGENRR